METFILTVLVVLLAIVGLAVGTLLGRGPIKGSCGGLACLKGIDCGACKSKHDRNPS